MPSRSAGHRRGALLRLAVVPLLALGLASGGGAGAAAQQVWPGQTWATTSPAAVGMDPALLQQGVGFAAGFGGAGMVVRQGQVVASWGDTNALVNVRSVAKSFGSILLGLAVDDGRLALADRAADRLPGFGLPPEANAATGWLPLVTLEHLATHTAGFGKDGGYVGLRSAPGTAWAYSDGGANWLGDVLTRSFGRDLAAVLRERVLTPVGVPASALAWGRNTYRPEPIEGVTRRAVSSSISASVDAMARVGLLMARGGEWDGARVLSAAYVQRAARAPDSTAFLEPAPADAPPATANPTRHYGLLWWNNNDGTMRGLPTEAFWAWGLDDAIVLAVPSLDLVVARHGPRITDARFGSYAQIAPFLSPIARSVQRANAAPVVSAGPDLALPAPGEAALLGRYADDGLPGTNSPGAQWSTVSGPAAATFASATRPATRATFPTAGTYKLKLLVNDRELKGSDTVTVRVGAGP